MRGNLDIWPEEQELQQEPSIAKVSLLAAVDRKRDISLCLGWLSLTAVWINF